MKKVTKALILVGLIALPPIGYAQTAPAPAQALAQDKPPQIWGFDFTGYVDVGYTNFTTGSGKFTNLNPAPPGTNSLHARVFDFDRNGLNLQNLELQLAKQPESGFGGLVDLTIGKDADTIASYGTINTNSGPGNGVNKKFDVTQAFAQYASGPFTIIGGKFVTLAGAEVIKSRDDTNYSRSILFGYAIPFTHTGLRGTYKVSDVVSLVGGINQGWDAVQDTNSSKTLELGATITPTKEFTLVGAIYSGKEKLTNYPAGGSVNLPAVPEGTRNLLDLVATYNATDKLTFIVNYDYGSQQNASAFTVNGAGTAHWVGWAGYVNYTINDQWKFSLRGEWFNDKDGYRTAVQLAPLATSGQKWKEGTFTIAYTGLKNLELRGEVRFDRSDQNVFLDRDGVTAGSSQNSIGLEALYKF